MNIHTITPIAQKIQLAAVIEPKTIIPLIAITMITLGMMMRIIKRKKNTHKQLSAQEQIQRNRQQQGLKADLTDLMVEIQQLAQRLAAQLDNKTIQIEKLLDDTQKKINQLNALQKQQNTTSTPNTTTKPNTNIPQDPLTLSVHRLASQGLTPTQIAQKLNQHIGKIELILALAK